MTVLKRQKCPGCLPNEAGAIFKEDYTSYIARDEDWSADFELRNVCQNCGYAKPIKRRKTYDPMKCSAGEASKLNRFDLVTFHLFNPNGIMAQWSAFGDKIDAAIEAGHIKTGFWLVYGPTGYHANKLRELAGKKQFKVWDLNYTLEAIRKQIENGETELADRIAANTKGN